MMTTAKLFYRDPFLTECDATILEIHPERGIVTDQTVAFPEGGGQEADHGTMTRIGDESVAMIRFLDTQKGLGRMLFLPDFPTIHVDTPVFHVVEGILNLKPGDQVRIQIDVERRARLSVSHSALHLALMGLESLRPELARSIKGCHIAPDSSRLDFATDEKFQPDEIAEVNRFVSALVARDAPIEVFAHPKEPEAWYWRCAGTTYPCGGTHIRSARCIGSVEVRRRSMGRGLERLVVQIPGANPPMGAYHADTKR